MLFLGAGAYKAVDDLTHLTDSKETPQTSSIYSSSHIS